MSKLKITDEQNEILKKCALEMLSTINNMEKNIPEDEKLLTCIIDIGDIMIKFCERMNEITGES